MNVGYLPENEEKARRIVRLLHDVFLRDDLKDDFVLKGGTALNLYHWQRPRLSVDIDLDFVGAIEQDEMLGRKSALMQTLPQFARRLGYQCQTPSESYALTQWHLGYRSVAGRNDHIKIDVNWLCRSTLLEPEWRSTTAPWSQTSEARAKVCHLHELCAGKMRALMDRSKPRDLMDAQHLVSEYVHEEPGIRELIILYGAAMSHKDLRHINVDDVVEVSDEEINSELWPVLHLMRRPGRCDGPCRHMGIFSHRRSSAVCHSIRRAWNKSGSCDDDHIHEGARWWK